jgi:hypothetical protein
LLSGSPSLAAVSEPLSAGDDSDSPPIGSRHEGRDHPSSARPW